MSKLNEPIIYYTEESGPVSINELNRLHTIPVHEKINFKNGVYVTIKENLREDTSILVSGENNTVAKSFTVNLSSSTLKEDGTIELVAKLGNDVVEATYTVTDDSIVTVAGSTVSGISYGTTTIAATYNDGEKTYSKSVTITVQKLDFTISSDVASVKVGEVATFTAKYGTRDVTADTTFSSSAVSKATVSGNKATGVAPGSVTITARYADKDVSATKTISVADKDASKTPTISNEKDLVTINGLGTVYYTTNGNAPTTSSSVYSSPFKVASGTTVKAIAVQDGLKESAPATKVITYTLDGPTVSVSVDKSKVWDTDTDKTVTVTATVTAGDNPVTKVTINGETITANASGKYVLTKEISATTTWTVVASDGKAADTTDKSKSTTYATDVLTVTLGKASIEAGQTTTATAKLSSGKSTTGATFTSSNTTVATISGSTITAAGVGTATITAKLGTKTSAGVTLTVAAKSVSAKFGFLTIDDYNNGLIAESRTDSDKYDSMEEAEDDGATYESLSDISDSTNGFDDFTKKAIFCTENLDSLSTSISSGDTVKVGGASVAGNVITFAIPKGKTLSAKVNNATYNLNKYTGNAVYDVYYGGSYASTLESPAVITIS